MSLHVKAVNLHLVTLSEKLGFLSGKNYDVFGSHQVCAVHYRNASPRCLSAELKEVIEDLGIQFNNSAACMSVKMSQDF